MRRPRDPAGEGDLDGVEDAVAGLGDRGGRPGTLLVEEGEDRGATAQVAPTERHPRTAAGVSRDGRTLLLAVADGRQPGWSVGVTLPELARLMIEAGAWNAVNLDGGGSSAMWHREPGSGRRPRPQPAERRSRAAGGQPPRRAGRRRSRPPRASSPTRPSPGVRRLRYARPPETDHARHPEDPGAVPHHAPALPGARPGRAEAAHLPGPRGEHPPADAGARDLQGLPRALLRQRPPRTALPLGDGDRPLRARLGRHLPVHPREPLRQHDHPLRQHDAGPRPRRPRDGAPRGRHPRLADGAPLERPPPPRPREGRPLRGEGRRHARLRGPRARSSASTR